MSEKFDNVPVHIAIIMDGNGRWAKKRLLAKTLGHDAGAQALKKVANEAEALGVKYLTVYAFSTENWARSDSEVYGLMDLLRNYIDQYIRDTKKNNMRFKVIGRKDRLAPDLIERISRLENISKDKTGLCMVIALDYGGRDEILRAVKKISEDCLNGSISVNSITDDLFANYLDTNNIPEPDLLIRTSGELRLSNFLLWQLSYSEFYFCDTLWPDFKPEDLRKAIAVYNERNRRFGAR